MESGSSGSPFELSGGVLFISDLLGLSPCSDSIFHARTFVYQRLLYSRDSMLMDAVTCSPMPGGSTLSPQISMQIDFGYLSSSVCSMNSCFVHVPDLPSPDWGSSSSVTVPVIFRSVMCLCCFVLVFR